MTEKDAKKLLEAIKLDDLTSFCMLLKDEKDLNISFGRYPLLTVCYLYNSKKILKKYEKQLLQIDQFKDVGEPFEIYKKFKPIANKSIRIYAGKADYVMPLEMLALLHKDFAVAKNYKKMAKAETTEKNLKKIYALNNQDVKIDENKIKVSHKKLSHKQKLTLLISNCAFVFVALLTSLILVLISNAYGLGTASSPKKIFGASDLSKLSGKSVQN